ncbi:MAG: hypothetical protein EBV21_09800, partial [Betaproteobacteria bacterium]|nr:hypothetical protein [Betaproteobacteria bacterium]
GETYLGNATIDPVNAQAWSYQVPTALADGLHRFRVDVFDPLTLQASAASPIYSISSNVLTLTPLDPTPAHRDNWVITTTSKPVFQGTLKALLAVDEVVAVYDSVDGISWSLLGTVDSSKMQLVSGSYQWSFDTPKAMFGQHTYRVQIEQRTPGKAPQPLLAIDQAVKFDFNSLTLAPSSDTGSSNFDNLSNVTRPTLLLHLAASSMAGDVVVLKVQGNNVNLTVTGQSTSRSTYTLSQADINAGVVSLAPPDLYQLLNAEGNPSRDGTFTLNATVGGVQVVSPINYKLDTTAPVYTPVAKIQNLTGVDLSLSINTGYTSDKTLVSHSAVGADKTAHEQVKVVHADNTMSIVKDWLSLADFNADSLADGHYTLYTRMVDTAGNVGKPGDNIDLRLDTQAATLSTPALAATAAATQALQTDAWLNQNEVTSTLQYKLEFTEKIKGLSLSHLQLVVSGAANQWPALESVSPVELDANGYASVWMVKVKDLSQLTDADTLSLRLLNGVGVVDQAGNHNDSLSFTTTPLTVDLTARYSVSSVKTLSELNSGEGLQELLIGGANSFTINGKAQQAGVRITGTTVGVEAGQAVEVSLIGKDGDGNPVVMGSPVSTSVLADHTWTLDFDATALAQVLTDKTDYTLKVTIQDRAGNTATGTALALKARLTASIDVNLVEANSLTTSGENGTVLDFSNTDTADRFVNLKDKQNGSVGAIDPDDTGFSIRGTSNIGTGRTITVTLSKVGMTMVPVIETGTVQSDGSWSVHVSSGAVGNFTD